MRRNTLNRRFLRDDKDPADGGTGGGGGGKTGEKPGDKQPTKEVGPEGFPVDTPIAEMTSDQQVAYWKHQARKHEQRSEGRKDYDAIKAELDRLKAESQTDAEKAIEQAKKEAADVAKAAAAAEFAPRLVAAKLEAALAGKMPADKIAGQVEFLDHTKFLTEAGEVDTDKVSQYAAGLVPAGKEWPDTGQGNHGTGAAGPSVQSGYDRYAERHKKKSA